MLFDRGVVPPGQDAGYVDSPSSFGGKAFPGPIRQYNPGTQPFLKVNRHGQRFANESCPYNDIVYAAAHQPGRVYAQIHDDNWYEDVQRFHTIGCSAQTRAGGPDYVLPKMEGGRGRRLLLPGGYPGRAGRQAGLHRDRQGELPGHGGALQRAVRRPRRMWISASRPTA